MDGPILLGNRPIHRRIDSRASILRRVLLFTKGQICFFIWYSKNLRRFCTCWHVSLHVPLRVIISFSFHFISFGSLANKATLCCHQLVISNHYKTTLHVPMKLQVHPLRAWYQWSWSSKEREVQRQASFAWTRYIKFRCVSKHMHGEWHNTSYTEEILARKFTLPPQLICFNGPSRIKKS